MRRTARTAAGLILGAAMILAAPACASEPPEPSASPATTVAPARLVDPDAYAALIADNPGAPVINVHVPYEGHIAGTTDFIAYDTIATADKLPAKTDQLILLYCRSGNMSAQAAFTLAGKGYTNIVDLQGGMNAWTAAGRPLDTTGPT
jgi:phage shock protein E